MDLGRTLALVANAFAAERIPFGLIGGMALSALGVPRATGDVDFLVDGTRADDADRLLTGQRYRAIHRSAEAANYVPGDTALCRVDLLFANRPPSRAMLVDPAVRQQYLHFLALAHLLMGNDETAAAMFRERIRLAPETDFSRSMLAAALGHLGQADEARRVWAELMTVNPKYSFADHMRRMPFKDPAYAARIAEGLAKAGLPDQQRGNR